MFERSETEKNPSACPKQDLWAEMKGQKSENRYEKDSPSSPHHTAPLTTWSGNLREFRDCERAYVLAQTIVEFKHACFLSDVGQVNGTGHSNVE
ncbi:unnamed protein product [Caenorhabditis auriculariae]|uniref:Uncharacterized protein n=1 Tax=Caenorhabditis auriculariae TaxID=2777116 RepID=A0A8S1H503_9PELO|nr:unnamed protein product [Caenorhabditis auriculariae]